MSKLEQQQHDQDRMTDAQQGRLIDAANNLPPRVAQKTKDELRALDDRMQEYRQTARDAGAMPQEITKTLERLAKG